MKKILIISTGGTFNKIYNPKLGILEIDKSSNILKDLSSKWLCNFEILHTIGKDSLAMTNDDRDTLSKLIRKSHYTHILIIHGTDTMDLTASYLADAKLAKTIILTGAMVPYSINPIEATANLASAYGYLQAFEKDGVYIAMNGVIGSYKEVKKNRQLGKFSKKNDE
jgi:L-asparaginase